MPNNEQTLQDALYEQVARELSEKKMVSALMARAAADSNGNKEAAQSLYIKYRFEQLMREYREGQSRVNREFWLQRVGGVVTTVILIVAVRASMSALFQHKMSSNVQSAKSQNLIDESQIKRDHQKWTADRIQKELLSDPAFVSAAQWLANSQGQDKDKVVAYKGDPNSKWTPARIQNELLSDPVFVSEAKKLADQNTARSTANLVDAVPIGQMTKEKLEESLKSQNIAVDAGVDLPRTFTVGSTQQDVRRIQGSPSSIMGDMWWYGEDYVSFDDDGKVEGYSNSSGQLKIR